MMSAGAYIVHLIRQSAPELRATDIARAAEQFGIPEAWARHYRDTELQHPSKVGR